MSRSISAARGHPRGQNPDAPPRYLGGLVAFVVLLATALAGAWCLRGSCQPTSEAGQQAPAAPSAAPSPNPSPSPTPSWATLRSLAPVGLRIGTAVDSKALATDPTYASVLSSDFNAVTAESAMKWSALEPSRGTYDWTEADRIVEFARRNNQSVYGHTLVWHTDVPGWISADSSQEELRESLRRHVTSVVSRYRGQVWAWDVVNEVLAEDGSLRDTLWLRALGPQYIADAFRWAHEADPEAVLFINEYGAESSTRKADALLRLVRDLRQAGVPVEGVGFQSHIPYDRMPEDVAGNLSRFSKLGVLIAITELDVRIEFPVNAMKYAQQADRYRDMLRACLSVSACVSFTVWGFTDSHSWIPGYHRGFGSACIFDAGLHPKPAHAALIQVLKGQPKANPGA